MRILYFGDGVWATNSLRALARTPWTILGVVLRARPTDPALLSVAEDLQLPIMQPRRVNDPEFLEQVAALKPDLNMSVSYDQILRRPILDSAPLGFINFHVGTLPCYRGRNVVNWAIINGEKEIGLTGHFVDEGIDTGDIILQRTLPIGWTDTYEDVLNRVYEAFPDFVMDTMHLIAQGSPPRQAQAHHPGTYFGKRGPGDEWIDWSDTSRNLHNKIRAITHPGPGARTVYNDKAVTVWRAYYDPSWPGYLATPGQVVGYRPGEGVMVKTGDSTLLVQSVQIEDGEIHTPAWPVSSRLGLNLFSYLQQLQTRVERLEQELQHPESGKQA